VGQGAAEPAAEAPPAAEVEREQDANMVKVDHPEQFPLARPARMWPRRAERDRGRQRRRIQECARDFAGIRARGGHSVRLGDAVEKGQLLLRVHSTDVSGALSDYRKAQADETLARAQLDRAKLLYDKGAIAAKDLEVAEDTYDKAKVDVETALEHLKCWERTSIILPRPSIFSRPFQG